jgi:hypothetical protein
MAKGWVPAGNFVHGHGLSFGADPARFEDEGGLGKCHTNRLLPTALLLRAQLTR